MSTPDPYELQKQLEELSKQIRDLQEIVRNQIGRIWTLEQKINKLTYSEQIDTKTKFPATESPLHVATTKTPESVKPVIPELSKEEPEVIPSINEIPPMPEVQKPKPTIPTYFTPQPETRSSNKTLSGKNTFDLETEIGGNWLSKIGIAALFLGLAFLFQYAYQRGWINVVARVAIGSLTGFVLLFLGEYFDKQKKYLNYARSLTGGGLAVLYLSFYAAYGFYHLIDHIPSLGLMILTTIIAIFFAFRYSAEIIGIIGVIGGYLTPVILNSPMDDAFLYLLYCFILTAGIFTICYFQEWQIVFLLGVLGGYLIPLFLFEHAADYFSYILVYYFVITVGVFFISYVRKWQQISYLGVLGGFIIPPILLQPTPEQHAFVLEFYVVLTASALISGNREKSQYQPGLGILLAYLIPMFLLKDMKDNYLMVLTYYFIIAFGILILTFLRQWKEFSGLGILGAYLIPLFLLQNQTDQYLPIMIYYSLITAGVLVVAYLRSWQELSWIGGVGGYLLPFLLLQKIPDIYSYILTYYAILTIVLYFVSYLKNWEILEVIGVFGGYLVPMFLVPSYNHKYQTFPYLILLTLASILIGYLRRQYLMYLAFILTNISIIYWGLTYYQRPLLQTTETYLIIFFAIYNIGFCLRSMFKEEKFNELGILSQLLNAIFYFGPTYQMLQLDYPLWPGYIAIILIFYYLAHSYLVYMTHKDDILLTWNLVGMGSLFAIIAIPILLHQQWITIGWAVEAAILTWIGLKGKNVYLRAGALLLLIGVIVRLFFYDQIDILYPEKDFIPIFNRRFMAFLSGILSTYTILYLLQKKKDMLEEVENKQISIGLLILGNVLTLWLFSMEITDYIDNQWKSWQLIPGKTTDLWMIKQLALSCLWAVYSIILIYIGMATRQVVLRLFAMLLFGLTIVKVFFFDLSSLTGLPRILSFIVLGLILLLVSYMYQRFKEKLLNLVKQEDQVEKTIVPPV